MRFSDFIKDNLDAIVAEWENFARTFSVAMPLSDRALRDHCREILLAIAEEMETSQTDAEQSAKSKEMTLPAGAPENAATVHGALRQLAGFDLMQLVGEFRAMRASVMALWQASPAAGAGPAALLEITRFNEALDKSLAESVERYSTDVAASRDMFLAVLGHDLRSPLSVIAMSGKLLGEPGLAPVRRDQAVLRMQRASRNMSRLINDLLEFTRTRLGPGIPIERAACDLRPLCEAAVDSIQTSEPQHAFELQLAGDLRLQGDAARIEQMLSNLLHNAVQHGSPQSPVLLRASGEAEAVLLDITNRGRPIPPDALQAVFEPLVQLQGGSAPAGERSRTSMGLGLYIVREIVTGHGGTIRVQSTAEAGTVFSIRLPREAKDRTPHQRIA